MTLKLTMCSVLSFYENYLDWSFSRWMARRASLIRRLSFTSASTASNISQPSRSQDKFLGKVSALLFAVLPFHTLRPAARVLVPAPFASSACQSPVTPERRRSKRTTWRRPQLHRCCTCQLCFLCFFSSPASSSAVST